MPVEAATRSFVRLSHRIALCYKASTDRAEIIATLRNNEQALRDRGVCNAALFGSRARGDNRADSDTDFMMEIDPSAPVGQGNRT